jgi:hypothetical protein
MSATWHVMIGVLAWAAAAGMILLGRPNKYGESPKFMRHPAAFALYPVTALTFIAFGSALLIGVLINE